MTVLSLSDVWLDAFSKQATSKLIVLCRRHARWCLHEYRLQRGPQYDHEVVQNALADVFERRITWDPARASLFDLLCDVVRYRIRDEKRSRAARTPHVSIGRPGGGLDGENRDGDGKLDAEIAGAVEPLDGPEAQLARKQDRELGARIGAELAALADGDGEVAAIVTCLREGVSAREDVLAETGMTAEAYHNARRRLHRLKGRLSEGLRAKAEEPDR